MKFPDEPRTGDSIKDTIVQLMRYVRSSTVTGIAGGRVQQSPNGTTLFPGKLASQPVTSGAASGLCYFGEIITYDLAGVSTTGIRGGLIHCGDQNFEVPNQALNLAAPGDWLVYITVQTESNRDDDSEIFLPGIKTGTAPAGTWGRETWTLAATYPPNDLPTVATGLGDIILPIGRLTIADGVATLIRAGCGNFTIGQCAGILSYARG